MAFDPNQPRDSKGRWTNGFARTFVGAAMVATVTATSLGAGISTSTGALSVESSTVVRSVLNKAKQSAKKGKRRTTWKRLDLREAKRTPRRGGGCAANSYGQVQRFLMRTPCRSLDRVLYALDGGGGERIVVSVSWVRMRSNGAARALRELVDVHGTGNITPLPGALAGAGRIDWTGWNYGSDRSGRQVTIAEVEPLRGNPSADFMDAVAEVAAKLPGLR